MSPHRLALEAAARALLIAGLCAPPAAAGVLETRLLDWSAETLADGLTELREQFLDDSRRFDREHVGAVLRAPDGRIRFTHGVGRPGQDRVSFRTRFSGDFELLGFWHTHGAHGDHRELFSPDDAALVRETGLPFYLIDPGGAMRVLRPEDLRRGLTGSWSAAGSRLRPPPGSLRGIEVAEADGRAQPSYSLGRSSFSTNRKNPS